MSSYRKKVKLRCRYKVSLLFNSSSDEMLKTFFFECPTNIWYKPFVSRSESLNVSSHLATFYKFQNKLAHYLPEYRNDWRIIKQFHEPIHIIPIQYWKHVSVIWINVPGFQCMLLNGDNCTVSKLHSRQNYASRSSKTRQLCNDAQWMGSK